MSRRTALQIGVAIFLVAIIFTIYFSPEFAALVYGIIAFLTPVWLPALLIWIAWPVWLNFARSQFVESIPYETIELKPGPETPRTARPMELVFYSLYHRIEITKREYLLGHIRSPWSFEVYVHAGAVRFFVHVPKNQLPAVEARIRAEYHDIEIDMVRDYAREIPFDPSSMRLSMREYTLEKPDPYPLKTYEHHEGENNRDAFAEFLEELSALGKGEHFLLSYVIRPHQRERMSYFEDPRDTLHEDAYKVIGGIIGPKGDLHALSPARQQIVRAIEEALKKPSFDCGIRALYLAERGAYDEGHARKLETLFQRFGDQDLNGFESYDPAEKVSFFRKELFAISAHLKAEYLIQVFRRRGFFAPPYEKKPFILNTEELATIFHLPHTGRGSVVPHRTSVRLEPPVNLPV